MHEGHRKRMMDRSFDAASLQDHELLEILLFNPIPRKNTNEIAHSLLAAFGSLQGVFAATDEELTSVDGVGPATARYLKCVGAVLSRIVQPAKELPRAFNFHEFSAVLLERFKGVDKEYVDVFSLDAADHIRYIARYTSHEGDRAELTFEEISRFFLAHRPAGLVVAHNHPHKTGDPSLQDDAFTAQLQMLCSMNGVKLRDHIICGKDSMYSYFMHGRLEEMEQTFDVQRLLQGNIS